MRHNRLLIFFCLVFCLGIGFALFRSLTSSPDKAEQLTLPTFTPTPTPPYVFHTYVAPNLPSKSEYKIFLVGDSMTHALGPHGGTFYEYINARYKPLGIGILIDNYASGSTNILGVQEAMTKEITYWDSTFKPLLTQQFDLILIESFGYNPLSQYPLEEGLAKQTQALTEIMTLLHTTHPESRVAFVATIAPHKETYAQKIQPETSVKDRVEQAEERIRYIQNHMQYAKEHNIPLIDIYSASLDAQGDGTLSYINPVDSIHPSFAGVDFIGHELADYIYEQSLIPH